MDDDDGAAQGCSCAARFDQRIRGVREGLQVLVIIRIRIRSALYVVLQAARTFAGEGRMSHGKVSTYTDCAWNQSDFQMLAECYVASTKQAHMLHKRDGQISVQSANVEIVQRRGDGHSDQTQIFRVRAGRSCIRARPQWEEPSSALLVTYRLLGLYRADLIARGHGCR